ncbi:MAG: hypothetical protein MJ178_06900 [Treponemataceae bacterium]|nr:hypothetical protein [Treponemataceae bacterium]
MKIEIGMDYETVLQLIGKENIRDTYNPGTGYRHVYGWITIFDDRISASFSFTPNNLLKSISLHPQFHEGDSPSWDDASEEQLDEDYEYCQEWYSKYSRHLTDNTRVYRDERSWTTGIIIT